MSELKCSYKEVMFEIPFNHLLALTSSLNTEIKEKNTEKKENSIKVVEYKNRSLPQFNF